MAQGACFYRLLLFLDAVELLVELEEILLGEVDAHHTDHSRDAENGEAAEHLHHGVVHLKAAHRGGLFALFLLGHDLANESEKHELTSEGLDDLADLVIDRKTALLDHTNPLLKK